MISWSGRSRSWEKSQRATYSSSWEMERWSLSRPLIVQVICRIILHIFPSSFYVNESALSESARWASWIDDPQQNICAIYEQLCNGIQLPKEYQLTGDIISNRNVVVPV